MFIRKHEDVEHSRMSEHNLNVDDQINPGANTVFMFMSCVDTHDMKI